MRLLIRWIVSGIALLAAVWLVPGITVGPGTNTAVTVLAMAVVLGLVNALVRPVLALLSCPLIILTLGLFVLVINAVCLYLASAIAGSWFGIDFHVADFWSAFLGSLVISIATVIMTAVLPDDET